MSEYHTFNGSDPDIKRWEPKRADDEYQSQDERTPDQWFSVGDGQNWPGLKPFLPNYNYRRKIVKKSKFEYPKAKL